MTPSIHTRCQPGGLALVIRDDPGYDENLGRLVQVHPPLRLDRRKGPMWLIVPTSDAPYAVMLLNGRKRRMRVQLAHTIEHPDAWLMPIRDEGVDEAGNEESEVRAAEAERRLQARIDEALIAMGAVKGDR